MAFPERSATRVRHSGAGVDEQVKKRLVGAAVLVSLAVIFVPMLFDDTVRIEPPLLQTRIPNPPEPAPLAFESGVVKDVVVAPPSPAQAPPPKVTASPAPPANDTQAPAAKIGLRAWVVQVGSFADRKNAMQVVKKLRAAGFDTFLEEAQVSGKTVFRVRVGPEADRLRAQALVPQIKAAVGLDGSVRRYP